MAAYTLWGVAPVYFVLVGFAVPLEILAQRIVWSIPLLVLFITIAKQWRALVSLDRVSLGWLALCAMLLSINWLTFIHGISVGRIAETSLGYFINPLVTIALGYFFLAERLRPIQWIAVALAALGVLLELLVAGKLPWIAVTLALSFGFYGLVRKRVNVPSSLGLGVEMMILAPFAIAYLVIQSVERPLPEQALLALGGAVTTIPMVCFGAAAIRLPLTILGLIQYLAPSISLLIAIFVYAEPVSAARWITFTLVWMGIALFSFESLRSRPRVVVSP